MTTLVGLLAALLLVIGVVFVAVGALRLLTVPLAFVYDYRQRHADPGPAGCGPLFDEPPLVSVVVPAFNEADVVENCVRSFLRSDHAPLEIVLVDDGSSDDTYGRMRRLAETDDRVTALTQDNAGKGAALNTGIRASHGEVVVLVDADGLCRRDTLTLLLRGFHSDRVGAVGGNDRPVNLDRVLTRMLAVIGHVGTGLQRRVLDVLGCVPVVSGNLGAYRRRVLDEVGDLRTDTLGEDLELTWRVHRAGYDVAFVPDALVYAESPSTLRGLWRQRVRWARGLLECLEIHRDMVGSPRFGLFGPYLLYTVITQVVGPFVEVLAVTVLVVTVLVDGTQWLPESWAAWLLLIGVPLSLALLVLATLLDRAPGDLRMLPTAVLWPVYSTWMTFVMLEAARLELAGAEHRWNKLERTGTVSVGGLLDDHPGGR